MLHKYIRIALVVLPAMLLVSCESLNPNQKKPQPQIRIVDLDGNPKPVKNYVPEYNAKVLASQGMEVDQKTGNLAPLKGSSVAPTPVAPPPTPVPSAPASQAAEAPKPAVVAESIPAKEEPKKEEVKKENDVEYDLAADSAAKPAKKETETEKSEGVNGKKFKVVVGKKSGALKESAKKSKVAKKSVKSAGNMFIQIGSYSSNQTAQEMLSKNNKISAGKIEEANVGGKRFYRVMLGPISGQKKAEELLSKTANAGYKDAFIIKDK
jgi:hypothetical protein